MFARMMRRNSKQQRKEWKSVDAATILTIVQIRRLQAVAFNMSPQVGPLHWNRWQLGEDLN